ncbi:histidinol dehydrogenase [Candidatus Marsarchaeota G2 archaeon ECH_B_2]|uniref:Histidinol dehydrogenase n=3 Tax=Candidatus Marsarchaeota group 2 TaxID=2203771 RepID=A0A2R6B8L3_9ARCH|nr:MAG: histidinol dehydrogenase [Candidatus Marsarchaeota G2 archaeon ECH_B_2]PSN99170.1 MAG: histidinol dehydrogenase [Candidatus Marsarchaeota G2 archaeon ECH_B_3]PSO01775.1 MAG: histidinol dehydrogenase [Candidatus Marsarchaeota G2 archaeon ECH_B_1]
MPLSFLKRPQPSAGQNMDAEVYQRVREIINYVREHGDEALYHYTERFDGVRLRRLKLTSSEIDDAVNSVDDHSKKLIDKAQRRIERFARFQLSMYRDMELRVDGGKTILGQRVIPIESVGVYVPGGRFPLVSTALMTAVPAKVAGVSRIFASTPPTRDGKPNPAVVYALKKAGVQEVFSVGGAQAVAAFAYGTQSIPRVDKVVGPGNKYVNEAKSQLFGQIGIDLLAGPSEVLVVADDSADPELVAHDLAAQAEHDVDAKPWAVTLKVELAERILEAVQEVIESLPTRETARTSWIRHGVVAVADSLDEALGYANKLAPEHLELHLNSTNTRRALKELRNYGSLFIGKQTPVVFSDMLLGPNHVLPTGGASRFTGGLSIGSFLKVVTYQRVIGVPTSRRIARLAAAQSRLEGLEGHARSAEKRAQPQPPTTEARGKGNHAEKR